MYIGPAFTLIYVVAGLPLARLADTRSRSLVLIIGLVFWSVMVLLTGFAMVFWQLVVLRVMLGIGEVCASIQCTCMLSRSTSSLIPGPIPMQLFSVALFQHATWEWAWRRGY